MKRLKNKLLATLHRTHMPHRIMYACLAICHGVACVVTDKPELYGSMAEFYVLLALLK